MTLPQNKCKEKKKNSFKSNKKTMTEKKTTLPYLTDEEWKNLKGRHGKGKQVISFKLILARPRDIIVINKK